MRVRDAMTQGVVTATSDTPIGVVARQMADENVGAVVILDQGKLAGIVTDRDLVTQHLARGHTQDCPVKEAMTAERPLLGLVTIDPETDLLEAAQELGRRRVGRLPVVEQGRVIGMLSAGDVAQELRRALDGLLTEGEKATTDAGIGTGGTIGMA